MVVDADGGGVDGGPAKRRRVDEATEKEKQESAKVKDGDETVAWLDICADTTGAPPAMQAPAEIATFSLDDKREYVAGSAQLKYYHPPRDLSQCPSLDEGFETFVRRDGRPEYLDNLLRALQSVGVPTADGFITWRGIMTRVLCTPYDRGEWEFAACRVGAHIYLCEFKGADTFASSAHERSSYWGFKFEQLMTLPSREPIPWEERRRTFAAPVNNIEEFCSVVKTRLGAHRLVLGAEIDCADPAAPVPRTAYVELKTAPMPTTERADISFRRHRLLKFWAQSFLAGVPTVVVGFRDDSGRVRSLSRFTTSQLPRIARDTQPPADWHAGACLRFGEAFLAWLSKHVVRDGREHTYIVRRRANSTGVELVYVGDARTFLPDWFSPPRP